MKLITLILGSIFLFVAVSGFVFMCANTSETHMDMGVSDVAHNLPMALSHISVYQSVSNASASFFTFALLASLFLFVIVYVKSISLPALRLGYYSKDRWRAESQTDTSFKLLLAKTLSLFELSPSFV